MKRTVQPGARQASRTGEPKRSRPLQQTAAPGGRLAQLAAMMNSSPRVQKLAQLKDDIQRSPRVQDLTDLAAEINQGAITQRQKENQSPDPSSMDRVASQGTAPGSRAKETAHGRPRLQKKKTAKANSQAAPSTAQCYREVGNFSVQQADSSPLFTTEAVDPELTYSRSWTELWMNKNYRVQYPTSRPDPASVGLLAADDNSLAIHDTAEHPKEFYASPDVIGASNTGLERVQSSVRLASMGNSVTVSGQKLQKVEPQNVRDPGEDDGSDFAEMLQHECFRMAGEVIGMKGDVQSEVALGKGVKRSVGINPNPQNDPTIDSLTRTLARSGKSINPHSVLKGIASEKGLSEQDARTYGKRSGKGKLDKTASALGLNQFAEPEVGEAYAIFSNAADAFRKLDFSKLTSGGRPTQRDAVWGYHFAGVVARSRDGKDRITLENYSRAEDVEKLSDQVRDVVLNKYRRQLGGLFNNLQGTDRATFTSRLDFEGTAIARTALNEFRQLRTSGGSIRRWFFQIYGTKAGQTFHEKQAASGAFVNPLTVRVQKPLTDLKKDTIDQVDQWAGRITAFKEKYEKESESVLAGPDLVEAVEDFKGKVRRAHSQEAILAQKLRVKGPVLDGMLKRARSLRERELERFIGSDKSFFENLTDFSLRLDSGTLSKDLDSLVTALAGLRNLC